MKKISLFTLTLLIISSIDNIKNLSAVALCGSALIPFFVIASLFFLIPTALVSAALSSAFPEKGGIYHWVGKAFGNRLGMTAVWLQWINTMVWYPTMLCFIAGTAAYLFCPDWADHRGYLVLSTLSLFWGLTWINLKGVYVSSRLTNICAVIGTMIPMLCLIGMGVVWVLKGGEVQISLEVKEAVSSLSAPGHWVSLIGIMASFLGMELSGVHITEVAEPKKNFPRAVFLATLFIFFSMGLSSLALALVVPQEEIQLVAGVMQVFRRFFEFFGLEALTPLLAFCITIGSIGTMVNWLISPAKGLLHAAECGFLPSLFTRKNQQGVAAPLLLGQGVVVSLFCLVFLFQPSVSGFFWFLVALSTELYMIMYILMFCAAIKLGCRTRVLSLLGLLGCLTTIGVAFIPPNHVNMGYSANYLFMIGLGNLIAIAPLFVLFQIEKRRKSSLSLSSSPLASP